jgi:hypothetical protein
MQSAFLDAETDWLFTPGSMGQLPFARANGTFHSLSTSTSSLHALSAGLLVSADSYMNFQLSGAEEWVDGVLQGKLGDVLIRCNNVLHVSEAVPRA